MSDQPSGAPAAAPPKPPAGGSAAQPTLGPLTILLPASRLKRPAPDSPPSQPPPHSSFAPGTLFDPTSLHCNDDSRATPGVDFIASLWTKALFPTLTQHLPLVEVPSTAVEQATHVLTIMGIAAGLSMRLAEKVRDKDAVLDSPLQSAFEAAFVNGSEGRTLHTYLPSTNTSNPTISPTSDLTSAIQGLSQGLQLLTEAQTGFARAQESSQRALVTISTRLDKLERRDPGRAKDPSATTTSSNTRPNGTATSLPPSTTLSTPPTNATAVPLSYAAVTAAASAAPPANTTTTPPRGKPSKPRQPPRPSVKARTPTLVINFKGNPIPATQRLSDRSTTAQLRALIATIPTASSLTLLAANWNSKGNCVLTFASGPRTIDQIDKHADIFAQSICLGRDVAASRVEPRTKLQVSMVPVWDLNATDPFSESDLLTELLVNRSIHSSDLASSISYTKPRDKIDPSLRNCPVTFWVHDRDGSVSNRILAQPIYLFGRKLRVTRYRNLPALTQCTRCQKLGHSTKSCQLPVACAVCGLSHKTENHRQQCRRCAAEAITQADCPHPPCCVNCLGEHPASASRSVCKVKRRYARSPDDADDNPTSDDDMDS